MASLITFGVGVPIPSLPYDLQIEHYAHQYQVNPTFLLSVAECESNLVPTAIGDHGKAQGIFQFWEKTFYRLAKEMGENLDYYNPTDQIKLAAWSFAHGHSHEWTCAKIVKNNEKTLAEI